MERSAIGVRHGHSLRRAGHLIRRELWRSALFPGLLGLLLLAFGAPAAATLPGVGVVTVTAALVHRRWRLRVLERLRRRGRRLTATAEHSRDLARAAMTERRLLDVAANLRATQGQLERDMAARQAMADQLSVALVRADEANRAKSAFLASMSHELRTPLNAIIGFSDILHRTAPGLAANHRTFLERINRSGRHLLAIINDILDLSRIESGKVVVDLRETELEPLIREVVELHAMQVAEGVRLEVEVPPGPLFATTDAMRLRQILVNLVSNALKFTSQGRVVVRVLLNEHQVPARIEVEDSGIGIDPARLDAIFDPFEQADNTTARTYGGTGLGLAICRQLCALLDTRLSVSSIVGTGTTFSLHLPVAGIPLRVRDLPAGTSTRPITVDATTNEVLAL